MKLFAIILVAALLAVCERPPSGEPDHSAHDHSNANHGTVGHSAMASSPGAAAAPHELQFIDTMIAHHQGAVEMALLVRTRSQRPEMKAFAQKILDEQRAEIARMRQWRGEWFPDAKPAINMEMPGMHAGMTGMDLVKLDALKANEFDLEFIRQMIPHHEGAVEMAKALNAGEKYHQLKALAGSIIASQSAELTQMRTWLQQWQTGN